MIKLDPRKMIKNPVMFVVEVGSVLTTVLLIQDTIRHAARPRLQSADHSLALVHGAVCELCRGHGRRPRQSAGRYAAQGQGRDHRITVSAPTVALKPSPVRCCAAETSSASKLRNIIAGDGEVIEGVASVDESAITGESAPVIREAGGDRSAVTGGTRVLSDWIMVRITSNPGETFLDRMIALVEGAQRQKTPNEIALSILALRAHHRLPAWP